MFLGFIGGFSRRQYSESKKKFENSEVKEVTEEELKKICEEAGLDGSQAAIAKGLGASVEVNGEFYKVKK